MTTANTNEIEAFKSKRNHIISKLLHVQDEVKRAELQAELDACDNVAGLIEVENDLRSYIANMAIASCARKSTSGRGQNVPDYVKADIIEQVNTAKSADIRMSYKAIQTYAAHMHNVYLSPAMIHRIIGGTARQSSSIAEKIEAIKRDNPLTLI
jgi:hypothetical protein